MKSGGVATPHMLATAAGYEQLEAGGSAVDAALAAAAVLAVVLPNQCSIGGDIIAAVSVGPRVEIVNGSGRAGSRAEVTTALPTYGARTVSVPGVVDAWSTLHARAGRRPWAEVLQPAITAASEGATIAAGLARAIDNERARITADPGLTRLLMHPDGKLRRAGETLVQPELAQVLDAIAADGRDAFYLSDVAASIAGYLETRDGFLTVADFRAHTSTIEDPVSVEWDGFTWFTSGPSTQGVGFLQLLDALTSLGAKHELNDEAAALLAGLFYAVGLERDEYLGADVAPDVFLDQRAIERLIDRARKGPVRQDGQSKPSGDTVAISAMDADGGAVTIIQSVFHAFGSGILEPSTGIVLQNRGSAFTTRPGPNQLRPGARPMHTLMPVLVGDGTGVIGAHGTMGGKAQPQIHAQLALSVARGLTAQQAVDAPRCIVGALTADSDPATVLVEPGVDPRIGEGAVASGFPVSHVPRGDDFGHAQIVRRRRDGGFDVGSDGRADGGPPAVQ